MDVDRLRIALGQPATAWIVERVRRRLERGTPLQGSIMLKHPSHKERSTLDRLLGRRSSVGGSLSVDLRALASALSVAGICDDLAEAVIVLGGPIQNRREITAAEKQAWDHLFMSTKERFADRPELVQWVTELQELGLLRRLSNSEIDQARDLLKQAVASAHRLPARGVSLAQLAASVVGDSHGLDRGRPLGALVFRAAAHIGGLDDVGDTALDYRDAWASVGVDCDELGITALTLNLPAAGTGVTDAVLQRYRRCGEPARLLLRHLLRHPPTWQRSSESDTIFVCENRTIVALAADRLGAKSLPLVCTDGQPSSAVRVLLTQLRRAGFCLKHHGDFDWGGIRIANLIRRRHGADPWRMTVQDYRQAAAFGSPLTGEPVSAAWDEQVSDAMQERRVVVHEEQVVDQLLADLAAPSHDIT